MPTADSSGKSLANKLGLKDGHRVAFVHAPANFAELLGDLQNVTTCGLEDGSLDYVQGFYSDRSVLEAEFITLKGAIKKDGMLWICWPKKSSKKRADLDNNIVREIGLLHGLVDVKIAAIDMIWSGLKFVFRISDR